MHTRMNPADELKEPVISFTPWRHWEHRGQSPLAPAQGGVYLFAYCTSGAPPQVESIESLPVEVIYVGDAKDLNKRPLTGRHHRIQRFQELFGNNTDSLFVAFAPLYNTGCEDSHVQRAFSFYAEAMLVWTYTKRHGHPPAMHYKDRGRLPEWLTAVLRKLKGCSGSD